MLPEPWAAMTHANPVLYMVDGLRHGIASGYKLRQ